MANILKFKKKSRGKAEAFFDDFFSYVDSCDKVSKSFKESGIETWDNFPYVEDERYKDINDYVLDLIKDDGDVYEKLSELCTNIYTYIHSPKEFSIKNTKHMKQMIVRLVYAYCETLSYAHFAKEYGNLHNIFPTSFLQAPLVPDDGFDQYGMSEHEGFDRLVDILRHLLIFIDNSFGVRERLSSVNHKDGEVPITDFDRTVSYWFYERIEMGYSLALKEGVKPLHFSIIFKMIESS